MTMLECEPMNGTQRTTQPGATDLSVDVFQRPDPIWRDKRHDLIYQRGFFSLSLSTNDDWIPKKYLLSFYHLPLSLPLTLSLSLSNPPPSLPADETPIRLIMPFNGATSETQQEIRFKSDPIRRKLDPKTDFFIILRLWGPNLGFIQLKYVLLFRLFDDKHFISIRAVVVTVRAPPCQFSSDLNTRVDDGTNPE